MDKNTPDLRAMTYTELVDSYNSAVAEMGDLRSQIEEARLKPIPGDAEERQALEELIEDLEGRHYEAVAQAEVRKDALRKQDALERARQQFRPIVTGDSLKEAVTVREPDLYVRGGRHSFLT